MITHASLGGVQAVRRVSHAQTRFLLAKALSQAFPSHPIQVHRAQAAKKVLYLTWDDGPTEAQVKIIADHFLKFNPQYWADVEQHWLISCCNPKYDGQVICFDIEQIIFSRAFTDSTIEAAINLVWSRFGKDFKEAGYSQPTADQYGHKDLSDMRVGSGHSMRALIEQHLPIVCRVPTVFHRHVKPINWMV